LFKGCGEVGQKESLNQRSIPLKLSSKNFFMHNLFLESLKFNGLRRKCIEIEIEYELFIYLDLCINSWWSTQQQKRKIKF